MSRSVLKPVYLIRYRGTNEYLTNRNADDHNPLIYRTEGSARKKVAWESQWDDVKLEVVEADLVPTDV